MADGRGGATGPEIDLGIAGLSDYRQIGSGGFATVYSAFERNAGRRVAVKVLSSMDEAGHRRFDRECLAMGTASEHPNVVTLLRAGYLGPSGVPYLVMEYLSGGSLAGRLSMGPVPWAEALGAVTSIAGALGFSHGLGVLHKDVKPANILVSRAGVVKLTDFGIAAMREAGGSSQVAYSINYTSPESFEIRHHPETGELIDPRDERSDLYSLAATLYALGTGRPPFQGSTPVALMHQIVTAPVPPTGDDRLDAFFSRALAKRPDDRPPTAARFIDDLRAIGPTRPLSFPPPRPDAPPGAAHADPLANPFVGPTGGANLAGPRPQDADPDPATAVHHTSLAPPPGAITNPNRHRRHRLLAGAFAAVAIAGGLVASLALGRAPAPGPEPEPVLYTGHRDAAGPSGDDSVHELVELDDGRLASASADGTVRIWHRPGTEGTDTLYTGHRDLAGNPEVDAVFALVLLPDGRLASGGVDGTVQIWDPDRPGAALATYTAHRDRYNSSGRSVHALAVLSDGRVASGGAGGTIHVWDPDLPGEPATIYTGHRDLAADPANDAVWAITGLDDGRVASGSADGTVHVWDPDRPGEAAMIYTGHRDLAADPGDDAVREVAVVAGGRIASGAADGAVQIWDPDRPDQDVVIYGGHRFTPDRDDDTIRAITGLADGRIASGGADGTVHLWQTDQPSRSQGRFAAHTSRVNHVLVLSDQWLASASEDGTVRIWDPANP